MPLPSYVSVKSRWLETELESEETGRPEGRLEGRLFFTELISYWWQEAAAGELVSASKCHVV